MEVLMGRREVSVAGFRQDRKGAGEGYQVMISNPNV